MTGTGIAVLVLEDNPDDVVLIADALEQNGFSKHMSCMVSTLARAKEQLAQRAFDVILADLNVPDSLGWETVDALRSAADSTPLVVLTGTLEPEAGIDALQRGAQDYLPKFHVTPDALARSIRYAIERVKVGRALREANDRFRSAFDDSPIGMIVVGLDPADPGAISQANEAFSALTGYSQEELSEMKLSDVIHVDDRAEHDVSMQALVSGREQRLVREQRFVRKDAQTVWARTHFSAVSGAVGPAYAIGTAEDVTDAHLFRERLVHRASHDGLTGLINRDQLKEHVSKILALRERARGVPALLFCDLDHFKYVNDGHGHATGDAVLRETADRVSTVLRAGDVVARLGGDEFVVFLSEVPDLAAAVIVARKVRAAVGEPMAVGDVRVEITTSVGIALAGASCDAHQLLGNADTALYQAKRYGRDRIAIFDEVEHHEPKWDR